MLSQVDLRSAFLIFSLCEFDRNRPLLAWQEAVFRYVWPSSRSTFRRRART